MVCFFFNQYAFRGNNVSCVHVKTHQVFFLNRANNLFANVFLPNYYVYFYTYTTTYIWFHFQNCTHITMYSFNGSKSLQHCGAIKENGVLKSVHNELQCAVLGVLLTPFSLILVFLWKTTLIRNH